MTVLIAAESYFGNTHVVAKSIASGLAESLGPDAVTVPRPSEAPRELDPAVGLLFDTSLEMRFSLGSAAKSAHRALKKRGFRPAERGESFRVAGMAGPLVDDEDARARSRGAQPAAALHT